MRKKHNFSLIMMSLFFALSCFMLVLNGMCKTVNAEISASLIAHYEFDDAGNLGKDSTEIGNDLLVNGTGVNKGIYGIKLDGTSMLYAPYETGTTKDFSDDISGSYTLSFWMARGTNNGYILQSGPWETGISIAQNASDVFFKAGAGETLVNFPIASNEWHYVTIVADDVAGKAYYYLDGVQKSSINRVGESFTLAVAGCVLTLGGQSNPNDNWFANSSDTSFDDVRIYNGTLTVAEISEVMAFAGITAGEDGTNVEERTLELIAHYEFDDKANLGKDSTENGNDLLVNGVGVINGKHGVYLNGDGTSMLYAPYETGTTKDFSDDISGSYTLSFWMARGTNNGYILQSGPWETGISIAQNASDVFFKAGAGETLVNFPIASNEWHYVTIVADDIAGKAYYYLNGVQKSWVNRAGESFTMAVAGCVLTLGGQSNPNDNWFANSSDTSFDDVRIYKNALNATEIGDIMNFAGITLGEDGENYNIVEPETEGSLIARYEFKDADNMGKDSVGNFNLNYVSESGILTVDENEGAVFAGNSALYAPVDFSDYISDYTVSLWLKYDNTGNPGYIISSGQYENTFHISAAFGKLFLHFGPSGTGSSGIVFNTSTTEYTHVVVTASKTLGEIIVYVNGEIAMFVENVDASVIGMGNTDMSFTIGAQSDNVGMSVAGLFTGCIKDVRIYNGMLKQDSIVGIYNGAPVVYDEKAQIKTSETNLVVSAENSSASIMNEIGTAVILILGNTEYNAKIAWIGENNGKLRAVIKECETCSGLVGTTVSISLRYEVEVSVEGEGILTINGNDAEGYKCNMGDALNIAILVPDYYECLSASVGTEQIDVINGSINVNFDNRNITFYVVTIKYDVVLHSENQEDSTLQYDIETKITLLIPEKEGYEFLGWYADSAFGGDPVIEIDKGNNGNKEYYAKWIKIFKIEYVLYGGRNGEGNPILFREGEIITLLNAVKTGYNFLGWYLDENATVKIEKLENLTEDISLYVKFQVIAYTINFITDGGNDIASIKVNYGELLTLPEEPTKEGYIFHGWYIDEQKSELFAAYNAIENDITLYAAWNKNESSVSSGLNCKSSVGSNSAILFVVSLACCAILTRKKLKE
jgi:uncharacterized repeat protein (TIGR02543 family)